MDRKTALLELDRLAGDETTTDATAAALVTLLDLLETAERNGETYRKAWRQERDLKDALAVRLLEAARFRDAELAAARDPSAAGFRWREWLGLLSSRVPLPGLP